nr:WAS/WASL-interacting protein family member 3-like [Triticum aestivum]
MLPTQKENSIMGIANIVTGLAGQGFSPTQSPHPTPLRHADRENRRAPKSRPDVEKPPMKPPPSYWNHVRRRLAARHSQGRHPVAAAPPPTPPPSPPSKRTGWSPPPTAPADRPDRTRPTSPTSPPDRPCSRAPAAATAGLRRCASQQSSNQIHAPPATEKLAGPTPPPHERLTRAAGIPTGEGGEKPRRC